MRCFVPCCPLIIPTFALMEITGDFLDPISVQEISEDNGFVNGQLGQAIAVHEESLPSVSAADVVLVGISEYRGAGSTQKFNNAASLIRKHFYKLHHWHTDVHLADVGNVKIGAVLADSYAAIRSEVAELLRHNKLVVLLGGSHDVALPQYQAYKSLEKQIVVTCIDRTFDLSAVSPLPAENFLLSLLTSEPNYVKHFNHIGFQSYFVHPGMLETLDKLRFDSYRVGLVQTDMEEVEPVFRDTDMVTFDVSAIKYSDAPANKECPNGFTGVEACTLMRYAGMSAQVSSVGICGYDPVQDTGEITARQISQMLWYLLDGVNRRKHEADLADKSQFNEYHNSFNDIETTFLQSKRTGRWWMHLPNGKYVACSYADYAKACRNEIPERWLREQEREY